MDNDFYAVLGVSHTAEDCVIRAAYRALCQQHHPDKVPDVERETATARLARINGAYAVLSDPQKRKAYDGGRPSVTEPANTRTDRRSLLGRLAIFVARGLIVTGSVLLADMVAVEEKPWYRWAWDAATSLGADSSHYVVSWPLWLLVVATGVALAWRIGK